VSPLDGCFAEAGRGLRAAFRAGFTEDVFLVAVI
jgi:hypothetical protein